MSTDLATPTVADALAAIAALAAATGDPNTTGSIAQTVDTLTGCTSRVAAKKWLTSHHDATVATTQFSATRSWVPGPRHLNAGPTKATFRSPNGSTSSRHYAGMRCVAATPTTALYYDTDMGDYVLYQHQPA